MRLGKRERAALRQKEAAKTVALGRKINIVGRMGSMLGMGGRFFPVKRPVGKPKVDWSWKWRTAAEIRRANA